MNDLGYSDFLKKAKLTDALIWKIIEQLPDPVPHKDVDACFRLSPSGIHGLGMFAVRLIKNGEAFPLFQGGLRYNLARYTNHSDQPNAIANFDVLGNGWMTAVADIKAGIEVTMDYNDNRAKSLAALAAMDAIPSPPSQNDC